MRSLYKHKSWWASTIIVLLLTSMAYLIYSGFFVLDRHIEEQTAVELRKVTRLSHDELNLLQEGDIILRRGFGLVSDWIATRLNSRGMDFTHAGILTCKQGNWFVIHSLSSDVSPIDGMQIHSLAKFLHYSQPGSVAIVRTKDHSSLRGAQIAQEALYYLHKEIPFDHHGNMEEDDKLYCTELIWTILEKKLGFIQLPSDPEQRKNIYYSMRGLYDTAYFDIVLNQRISSTATGAQTR